MGVDVSARVMVGISFDSDAERDEYLIDNFAINVDEFDDIDDALFASKSGLEWGMHSGYGDYGGVLGEEVGNNDIEPSGVEIAGIYNAMYLAFPVEDHPKIKAHIWAQYW